MREITNLIDVEGYCDELSKITKIDINSIRFIVLVNFANMYASSQNNLSFMETTENIESQIYDFLDRKNNSKEKAKTLAVV